MKTCLLVFSKNWFFWSCFILIWLFHTKGVESIEDQAGDGSQEAGGENGRSRVVATVRFPPHAAVVDLERLRLAMINDLDPVNVAVIERYPVATIVLWFQRIRTS